MGPGAGRSVGICASDPLDLGWGSDQIVGHEIAPEARHPHQRAMGEQFGATQPSDLYDEVIETAGSGSRTDPSLGYCGHERGREFSDVVALLVDRSDQETVGSGIAPQRQVASVTQAGGSMSVMARSGQATAPRTAETSSSGGTSAR